MGLLCYLMKNLVFFSVVYFLLIGSVVSETIKIHRLKMAPTVDGNGAEWVDIPEIQVSLRQSKAGAETKVSSVSVRGGVFGDEVFFFLQWNDSTKNVIHRSFHWDEESKKYKNGSMLEDRLAFQFAMEGDYSTNWLSGKSFKADMWHWKAARSNPLGIAHDKMTIISREKVLRAYITRALDGTKLYIRRPSDEGSSIYRTKRYRKKQKAVMPKYVLNPNPTGSVADVKAKGTWHNQQWHLELKRKLDTGNPDDVLFSLGQKVLAGIAVFDNSGDDEHNISQTLTIQF